MRYSALLLLMFMVVGTVFGEEEKKMSSLSGKKVVMIIASQGFRDEEFLEPFNLLKSDGAVVSVASSKKSASKGALGKVVTPDLLVKDIVAANYDCVIFVGGPGATEYFADASAHKVAKDAADAGRLLCAICIAPATIANAGMLKGKKATCFPSVENALRKSGATLVNEPVVRDGKVITADGPQSAKAFAKEIEAALTNQTSP